MGGKIMGRGGPRLDKRIDAQQKRNRALQLSIEGFTFEEIAVMVGYGSAKSARSIVYDAMRKRADETRMLADEMREKELLHLLDLRNEAYQMLHKFHVHVTPSGKIVKWDNPATGENEFVEDEAAKTAAMNVLLRIQERISKLYKLEAPTEVDARVTVNYTFGGVDMNQL
jgi:hypothetical protein